MKHRRDSDIPGKEDLGLSEQIEWGWLLVWEVMLSCLASTRQMDSRVNRSTRHPFLWMSCNSVVVVEGEGRRKEARQKGGTRNIFKRTVWETSAGLSAYSLTSFERVSHTQVPTIEGR